jgi:hypothetical protein
MKPQEPNIPERRRFLLSDVLAGLSVFFGCSTTWVLSCLRSWFDYGTSMNPPRLTIRRLMLVVAVVALALGGFLWGRVLLDRRDRYLFEANWQRVFVDLARGAVENDTPEIRAKYGPAYEAMAIYHAKWEQKYRWAANHPWVVVEPDPDPPVDPRGGYPFMKDHPYGMK